MNWQNPKSDGLTEISGIAKIEAVGLRQIQFSPSIKEIETMKTELPESMLELFRRADISAQQELDKTICNDQTIAR